MAKYENPVRGMLLCPVCSSVATAHQCGEGQLIATGEPPKNSRNIGIMYYRCPECGNSPISKKVSEFVESHMVENESELTELSSVRVTEPLTEESTLVTESEIEAQASPVAASSTELTEFKPPEKDKPNMLKWLVILLGVLVAALWTYRKLKPKVAPPLSVNPTEKECTNG